MTIQINAKLHSLSEPNYAHTFEPNAQGLYNVSQLFSVFNTLKEEEVRRNPEYQGEFLESHIEGIRSGNAFFLSHMSDALGLFLHAGDYWGNKISFELCLRSCSDIFSKADYILADYYQGKLESFSYNDHAQYTAMKYAVYFPHGETAEAYKAYCIHMLAKCCMSLEFVQDFTVAHEFYFDKVAVRANIQPDALEKFELFVWFKASTEINELLRQLNEFDPELKDRDGFMLRYKSAIARIKERIDGYYPEVPPPAEVKPVKKKGFFERLLKGH